MQSFEREVADEDHVWCLRGSEEAERVLGALEVVVTALFLDAEAVGKRTFSWISI